MTKLPWNHRLAAVASLGDENRRRLFDFVASAADAVGRDDAAQAVGLARSTASFHLDRLVKDGLLAVEFRKLGGREGPGSGRPAKLYRAAGREPAGATGAGHADFAGSPDGAGGPDGPGPFANFLAGQGYCPADDGGGGLVLLNCPFHRLAAGHADVVCAMNGAFLAGASAALGIDPDRIEALAIEDLREHGGARPGQC